MSSEAAKAYGCKVRQAWVQKRILGRTLACLALGLIAAGLLATPTGDGALVDQLPYSAFASAPRSVALGMDGLHEDIPLAAIAMIDSAAAPPPPAVPAPASAPFVTPIEPASAMAVPPPPSPAPARPRASAPRPVVLMMVDAGPEPVEADPLGFDAAASPALAAAATTMDGGEGAHAGAAAPAPTIETLILAQADAGLAALPVAASIDAAPQPITLALPSAAALAPEPAAPLPGDAPAAADAPEAGEGPQETLTQALLDVLSQNPQVLRADARRLEAQYGERASHASLLPSVEMTYSVGTEETARLTPDPVEADRIESQIVVRQLLWDFGGALSDVARARALYQSSDFAFRREVDELSFEVASAYLQVLERQRLLALGEDNVAAHERILDVVQAQRGFGLVSGADVSRVEARLGQARAALLDREGELAQAREAFRRQLDRPPGDLAPSPALEPLIPTDLEAAIAMALENNPDLRQLQAVRTSLRNQRYTQVASFLPRVDLEAQQNWRENVNGINEPAEDSRVMLTMRFRPFDGGARRAALGRVDARILQADLDIEQRRRDVEQLIRNDYAGLSASRDKVSAIRDEVAAAERLVSLHEEQFRAGQRSVFDLLDSQETLNAARAAQITNETAREVSALRVLQSTGVLFETLTVAPIGPKPLR